jgi:hypothetical protein
MCIKVHFDGLEMDILAFHLFLRCAKGPATDLAVVADCLRDGFIGLGSMRELAQMMEEAVASTAPDPEAYGITQESQSEGLAALYELIATMEGRLEERLNQFQGEFEDQIAALQERSIPDENRIYPSAFVSEFYTGKTPVPNRVSMIFGGLICTELGRLGLRSTVGREETATGPRNVYGPTHLAAFEAALLLLEAALIEDSLGTTGTPIGTGRASRLGDYFFYKMSHVNRAELFRDISDQKLQLAVGEGAKETILRDRQDQLRFTFYNVARKLCADQNLDNHGPLPRDFLDTAFAEASRVYDEARVAKKTKADETEAAKIMKKEQKESARVAKAESKAASSKRPRQS